MVANILSGYALKGNAVPCLFRNSATVPAAVSPLFGFQNPLATVSFNLKWEGL